MSGPTRSQTIFVTAMIGTARIAPGTLYTQYQKIKARITGTGLSVKHLASSISVMPSPSATRCYAVVA